jgi:hypothetical protein
MATKEKTRAAEFDPDRLESLMATAFELLGKPEAEALELARAILRAGERSDQELGAFRRMKATMTVIEGGNA